MTILALNMSACYLLSEKSELEYEEMEYTNEYNAITSDITNLLSKKDAKTESAEYKKLQAQQQELDSKKNSVESKLKIINAQIEGYQEAVKNNIKSECKLSLSV